MLLHHSKKRAVPISLMIKEVIRYFENVNELGY